MKKLPALLAGLFFLLIAAAVLAEEDAEDYIIGARDILYVNVWGEANMEEKVEVAADGTIPFFYVGKVKVAGLSVSQARDRLTASLADGYIRKPVVILKVEEYRSKEVQIQGAISKPGTYVLNTNYTTILKLMSMAGGAAENRGNWAFVTRGETARAIEQQTPVCPVPEVGSAVAPAPGSTAFGWLPQPASGSTAAPAHGSTAGPAGASRPKNTTLAPNAQVTVDLKGLLDRGDYSQDIRIYPGDIILVGSIKVENPAANFIFVGGAVRDPKQLEFTEGMTALQAVIQVGGVSEVASANRATITRPGPEGGPPVVIRVRLRDIQRGKAPDVPLQAGDRINVPESIF